MPTIDLDSENRILKKIILEVLSIMAYHSERCHSAFLDALLLYKVGLCQRSMCVCWIRVCCQRFSINWSWDEREVCTYIPLEGHFTFVFTESSSPIQCCAVCCAVLSLPPHWPILILNAETNCISLSLSFSPHSTLNIAEGEADSPPVCSIGWRAAEWRLHQRLPSNCDDCH